MCDAVYKTARNVWSLDSNHVCDCHLSAAGPQVSFPQSHGLWQVLTSLGWINPACCCCSTSTGRIPINAGNLKNRNADATINNCCQHSQENAFIYSGPKQLKRFFCKALAATVDNSSCCWLNVRAPRVANSDRNRSRATTAATTRRIDST
jgi:hypothetical protein